MENSAGAEKWLCFPSLKEQGDMDKDFHNQLQVRRVSRDGTKLPVLSRMQCATQCCPNECFQSSEPCHTSLPAWANITLFLLKTGLFLQTSCAPIRINPFLFCPPTALTARHYDWLSQVFLLLDSTIEVNDPSVLLFELQNPLLCLVHGSAPWL